MKPYEAFETLVERFFGKFQLYATMGGKPFARISINGNKILIEITSVPVLIEAIVSHVLRQHRIESRKLRILKEAGYEITIKYGGFEYKL
jgi:hypothetical protein